MSDRPTGNDRDGHSPPAGGPLPVSTLRHDLKTAVNHIRGYGELLIEEAEDHGWPGLIPGLKQVVHQGGEAANLIDEALPTGRGSHPDLDGLCRRLVPLTESIRDGCAALTRDAAPEVVARITEDLNRVVTAAGRLACLLDQQCPTPGGKPPLRQNTGQEVADEDPAG